MSHCTEMGTTYAEALVKLHVAAGRLKAGRAERSVTVTLEEAVGRVAACDRVSPTSTPQYDTSAMDGYAVRSEATMDASEDHPVFFGVQGTIAAGDDPYRVVDDWDPTQFANGVEQCTEIMTGGRFPSLGPGRLLDACVRMEDVVQIDGTKYADSAKGSHCTYIAITKPVPAMANRRLAGEDIQQGRTVVKAGQIIKSSHLLPLASVGLRSLAVQPKPQVCVWSTGNELGSGEACTPDVNGLFLSTTSREHGADAAFLGVLEDDINEIARTILKALESREVDILITSGGVSVGKFDYIRKALDRIGAHIIFHGLAIRPGHPALFALIPSLRAGDVAFFGLPGNPGATAACFRFLVVPYLRDIMSQGIERPLQAKLSTYELAQGSHWQGDGSHHRPSLFSARDVFKPGVLRITPDGEHICSEMSIKTSPSLLSPYIDANCWIHFKRKQTTGSDDIVDCYAMSPRTIT
jgi:molybdopterin molybdotransferase